MENWTMEDLEGVELFEERPALKYRGLEGLREEEFEWLNTQLPKLLSREKMYLEHLEYALEACERFPRTCPGVIAELRKLTSERRAALLDAPGGAALYERALALLPPTA